MNKTAHHIKANNIVDKYSKLKFNEDYTGAFVFGSFANRTFTDYSDLDIVLIVKDSSKKESYKTINIDGVDVDICTETLEDLKFREQGIIQKAERKPWLVDSIILFDKTGKLIELKQNYTSVCSPKKLSIEDIKILRSNILKINQKVRTTGKQDKDSCCFTMTTSIREVVNTYYKANSRFTVQAKKIFLDLDLWDAEYSQQLKQFLNEGFFEKKIKVWDKIIEFTLAKLSI
ncbi:MAG: nucleotidyltransferase domain-containing protein [Patescibacteria group bacterium]